MMIHNFCLKKCLTSYSTVEVIGYHASTLTSSQYGAAVEEALVQYQDASKAHNVPMPQFHLLLNIMVSSVVVIFFYKTRQEDIVLSHDHVADKPSLQHT